MAAWIYRWHYRLGLALGALIILWGLSGLLHPLLRLTAPELATKHLRTEPLDASQVRLTPSAALALDGITEVEQLALIGHDGRAWYRVVQNENLPADYIDAASGTRWEQGDQAYAEALARRFSGDTTSGIRAATLITSFDGEYAPINRLLPVWRIEFDRADRLRVYVETAQGRLGTAVDDRRASLLALFRLVHTWSFLDEGNRWRIGLFVLAMLAMGAIALSGLWLYARRSTASARGGLRRMHRWTGLIVSVSTLTWALSGAVHALGKLDPDRRQDYVASHTTPSSALGQDWSDALARGPIVQASLVRIEDRPAIRIVHRGERHSPPRIEYLDAATGDLIDDGEARAAKAIARRFTGLERARVARTDLITRFGGEYGFIDKRLPVVRVQFDAPGNPRYYIETSTGRLAARVDDTGAIESGIFRYLHKWQFLNAIGLNGRDAIIAIFLIANIVVISLGTAVFLSRMSSSWKRKRLLPGR